MQAAFDALVALDAMEDGDAKKAKAEEVKVLMQESGLDVVIKAFMCAKAEAKDGDKKPTRTKGDKAEMKKKKEAYMADKKKKLKEFDTELATQKKKLYAEQKKCFEALFKYHAGVVCATCSADWSDFIAEVSGGYAVRIHDGVCKRLTKACFGYLVETEEAGRYYVQNIKAVNLKKNKDKLKKTLDATETALVAEDAATLLKSAEELAEFEEKTLSDLSAFKEENKKHSIVITLPEGCETEDDC